MKTSAWASFWLVGIIWGSSFLLIRVGVSGVSATQVVFTRTIIAAIGLSLLAYSRGLRFPKELSVIRALIILGIFNVAVPYTLISMGEQVISSGMAAVLQATAALFGLVIAHFAFADERITRRKLLGLAVGFTGVFLLSADAINPTSPYSSPLLSLAFSQIVITDEIGGLNIHFLLGQLAIVLASLCYAGSTTFSRKVMSKNRIPPLITSASTFIVGSTVGFIFMIIEPLLGGRGFTPYTDLNSDVLGAILGLGFVNTFIAYMFFYFIIQELGAFRATMVTYVVPAVGLILGWLVLGERISATMFIGASFIFLGIGIINIKLKLLFKPKNQFIPAKVGV
ncbi:MAG: DMT family transporter [Anaerolineae bacterium]|jgi:drug/metabolite transporter (DMT)-like permease|nr:DMT family transporter [Anaerolineae bacterium]